MGYRPQSSLDDGKSALDFVWNMSAWNNPNWQMGYNQASNPRREKARYAKEFYHTRPPGVGIAAAPAERLGSCGSIRSQMRSRSILMELTYQGDPRLWTHRSTPPPQGSVLLLS